jgi:hypothetical protein
MPDWGVVGDYVSKGLDKLTDSSVGRTAIDFIGSKNMELRRSAQGLEVGKLLGTFRSEYASKLAELNTPHETLTRGIVKDPSLRGKIDLASTPLAKVTDTLRAANHPLTPVSEALEKQTADNYTKSLKEIQGVNLGEARVHALHQSLGQNMKNLVPLIIELQDHPDPRMDVHAQRLLDIISNELKDTTRKFGAQGGSSEVSSVKDKVAAALTKVNKFRDAANKMGDRVPSLKPEKIDTNPTYKSAGPVEKAVSGWIRMVQVPLVAIPHIGTTFNLGSAPLKSLGKALLSGSDKQVNDTIRASGVLAATMQDMLHSFVEGRTGIVSKSPFLGPTAGHLLYSGTHTPGFSYLRQKQLWLAGAVGYHSVADWAVQAVNGDKRAIAELTEMGLDVKSIVQRGGQLTPKELQTGIFHFTNNRFFINRTIDSSLMANSNVYMRSATMYHSFLNAQVSFMHRELTKMMKAGDVMGIAQFAGSLGILFPSIAPMLTSLEILGRTGSTAQAGASLKKDYGRLAGDEGIGSAVAEYLQLLSHVGGMGVYTNYLNAASSHRLQAALLGPLLSTPATLVEDSTLAGYEKITKGKANLKPVERDITQDALPVIGKPLSHWLAPTTKEEPKVKLPRRGRRRF